MTDRPERYELLRPDATIRYRVRGPEQAPAVLLLHGSTLDHRAWQSQVQALGEHYRVVVPDLRGHGESTMTGRFQFDAAVADVLALLDEIELEHLAVCGLSLGGNIAQEIVYREPDRVDALIVADATCNTAPRNPFQSSVAIASLSTLAMASREHFLEAAATATALEEDVQQYVRQVNEDRPAAETVQILTSLLNGALHPDPGYRLPIPTLLLHGEHDKVGDIVGSTQSWAERDPRAEYLVVPDAGHASNQDNPEAFNAAVIHFLDRVLPSGRSRADTWYRRRAARRPWRRSDRVTRRSAAARA